MSGQHTPGPWGVERHPHSGHPLVADEGGYVVADCCNGEIETTSEEANARLIAAAPELLSACSDWIAWLASDGWREDAADYEAQMLDAMRAAIAKATGAA